MTQTDLFYQTLNLNCLVFQDNPDHVFPVEITISALKQTMKDKKDAFCYTDINTLAIWKVSIADNGNLVQNLKGVSLDNTDLLSPLQELQEVFVPPPTYTSL
jgi:hypothetical protein